ncbi:HAD family hydrolase [Cohnella sp. REN36]|uniref:HAD family hydrolase n=1 Tax=Cohnella sp. REN36 TaxID=2887347 RepID=UPI001D159D68|nr:HAD family hydrolase [Cohnella sp. REN36]
MAENRMPDKKKLILFLDSGDTIIDESSEIRDGDGIVIRANVIPEADEMVRTLHEQGYTLVLVADGLAQSFQNMYAELDLRGCFAAMIDSESVQAEKPSPLMFLAAAEAIGLDRADFSRVAMVGNNLARDVKGANALGITSVFLNWTPRYPHEPADDNERPSYTIGEPLELLALAERLNAGLS